MSNKNSSFEIRSVPTPALEFAKSMKVAEKECLDAGKRLYDVAMKVAMQFELSIIEFAIANKTTKIYAVNQVVENRDFPNKILVGSNYVFYSETEFESAKQAANNFKANITIYDLRRILMLSDEEFESLASGHPNKNRTIEIDSTTGKNQFEDALKSLFLLPTNKFWSLFGHFIKQEF